MSEEQAVVSTPEKSNFLRPVIQISVMVTVIVSTILTIFAWPVATATPKNIPVGITSTVPNLAQGVQTQFDQQQPGAFKFIEYKDLAAAKKAIAHREVYGALVLTDTPQMLIASGASPAMAQLLTNISVELGAQITVANGVSAISFAIEDLAPLGDKDPRGLGLSAGSLPLIVAGIVVGLLGSMRLRRTSQKFLVAGLAGTLASFSIVSILNLWLGSLQGNYLLEVLVVALGIAAVSLTVMGAAALAGRVGLLSVIGLFFIIGNPLGGVALPQELYPSFLGTLGQYLPLGAEVNLLRRISYFPEASMVTQWATLGAWLAVGVLLLVIAPARKPKTA
jgi:hypothetical protein